MNPVDLRLYALIGPENGPDLPARVAAAVAGGCTLVQYRDKSGDMRAMVARAQSIAKVLGGSGVPLLVNDRVDVALAAGADGVHLGQEDMAPEDARHILGPRAIIGLTVKTPEQADALRGSPVDYACIGGVFATNSKDNPDPPVGLEGLARIVSRVRGAAPGLPAGAIAGIGVRNAGLVIGAGADGIAVISAIFGEPDPTGAARRLRAIVDEALAARGA